MDMKELVNYGLLSLEPRIEGLPEQVYWWRQLKWDQDRIGLVSDPGQYYLEISAGQVDQLVPAQEMVRGVQAASLILNGRFSYEELGFVFRPNPGVEPMYVHCDKCGKPILAYHTTPPALESTTISNNINRCKHCGELKKWSKTDLWTLKGIRGQFSDEIIENS